MITIVYEEQQDGTWSAHVDGVENVVRIVRAGSVAVARSHYRGILARDARMKGKELEERVVRKKKS
jgi:hypothetical protein